MAFGVIDILSHSGAVPDIMNKAQLFQDRIPFAAPFSLYHKGRYVTIPDREGEPKHVTLGIILRDS